MKVTISHDFAIDPDTFWSKIFFDTDFNRALYIDHLGFPEWQVVEERDAGTEIVRRVRVTPKQDAPAVIKKLAGNSFSYTEEGRYDKAAKRYRFRVVPSAMADKFRTEGELRAEPLGEKQMRRVVEMTIDVKIALVGGTVESFVQKQTQESYAQAAAFTNRWIKDKGL
jgi:hypothetical protein